MPLEQEGHPAHRALGTPRSVVPKDVNVIAWNAFLDTIYHEAIAMSCMTTWELFPPERHTRFLDHLLQADGAIFLESARLPKQFLCQIMDLDIVHRDDGYRSPTQVRALAAEACLSNLTDFDVTFKARRLNSQHLEIPATLVDLLDVPLIDGH